MSGKFDLTVAPHGAFGALATLQFPEQPPRRFTLQEASIVARALDAVVLGTSLEKNIYMSPIASDQDFEARVEADGLVVACSGRRELFLSWPETTELANALKSVAKDGA